MAPTTAYQSQEQEQEPERSPRRDGVPHRRHSLRAGAPPAPPHHQHHPHYHASNAQAVSAILPDNPRQKFSIRDRAGSTGSTRGAFYQGQIPSFSPAPSEAVLLTPSGHHRRQQRKKKSPKRKDDSSPPGTSSQRNKAPRDADEKAWHSLEAPDLSPHFTVAQPRRSMVRIEHSGLPEYTPPQRRFVPPGAPGGIGTVWASTSSTTMGERSDRSGSIVDYGKQKSPHVPSGRGERLLRPSDSLRYSDIDLPEFTDPEASLYGAPFAVSMASNRHPLLYGAAAADRYPVPSSGTFSSTSSPVSRHARASPPMAPSSGLPIGRQPRQEEINMFASMAMADYGAVADLKQEPEVDEPVIEAMTEPQSSFQTDSSRETSEENYAYNSEEDDSYYSDESSVYKGVINYWLTQGVEFDEDGKYHFRRRYRYTIAGMVRHFLYNPLSPEFTSLQLFDWALVLGIAMGFYTALWKWFIEAGVDFFWDTVPGKLGEWGLFTDEEGWFPLYHYIWICPAIFGGILSYIFVIVPTPDQNAWINNVHSRGIQDHSTFFALFFLSTVGMWSGLSLGPELPLVLTAGMVGSWLALSCKQSMLQARVLNLTAASAAVGGFFGFPMAGALFVLEIPHRMGLQYFEALSPGTIASIVAVLTNRLVVGNDVTGYFRYPFLTATLPSSIFWCAVIYGFYGCLIGTWYTHGTKKLKMFVHDWFHVPHDDDDHGGHDVSTSELASHLDVDDQAVDEKLPLMSNGNGKVHAKQEIGALGRMKKYLCLVIPDEPKRASVAGTLAGALVGVIGMFVPHIMFWGEAQLQNLIDKGRTPLPIFGEEGNDAMTALAVCMIDPNDAAAIHAGFGIGCSLLISVTKTIVIGLSLGTGIVGGHFWGPLYVGCAASHLLTDLVKLFDARFGFGGGLGTHPCVVILCVMGAAHVVTFRAHIAIMLILTLTISAFDPEDENSPFTVAGDYSAVFPLLVVSVFLSLMASRDTTYYATQRCRGDITAVPEVLCRPGRVGMPLVVGYEGGSPGSSYADSNDAGDAGGLGPSDEDEIDVEMSLGLPVPSDRKNVRMIDEEITQSDIERDFAKASSPPLAPHQVTPEKPSALGSDRNSQRSGESVFSSSLSDESKGEKPSSRLDELLARPMETSSSASKSRGRARHRRIHSTPNPIEHSSGGEATTLPRPNRERSDSRDSSAGRTSLVCVESFGTINEYQPSLIEQAQKRAATSHRRVPSLPMVPSSRHRRKRSNTADVGAPRHVRKSSAPLPPRVFGSSSDDGALTMDDIDLSFAEHLEGGSFR